MELVERVNADFKVLIEKHGPEAQFAFLSEEMKRHDLRIGGTLIPTFCKPYFVDYKYVSPIAEVTRLLVSGIEKVSHAFLRGERFDGLIHQEGRWAELSAVDPLYPNSQVIARLDVFFHPHSGEMKFLEFNCGDPSGMGWHDLLLDLFAEMPAIKELSQRYEFHTDRLLVPLFNAVMHKYRQFCEAKRTTPKGKPNCAIVCMRGSTILSDVQAIANYFNSRGCNAQVADPRDFSYDGRQVSLAGQVIDVVYRDTITDFIRDETWNDCQRIVNAYKDGNICMVNPARSTTGNFKNMLTIMTDDRYHGLFDADERNAMKEYLPWTRSFNKQRTRFQDEEVDLIDLVRRNRDRFVLKPNVGYGGYGVVIGKETTEQDWAAAIEKAESDDYSVQEFVELPKDAFPIVEDGKYVGFESRTVNISYWSHDGQFAGAFVRASKHAITNVHQGGGFIPVYFVKG